jgi:hypothetical protein
MPQARMLLDAAAAVRPDGVGRIGLLLVLL